MIIIKISGIIICSDWSVNTRKVSYKFSSKSSISFRCLLSCHSGISIHTILDYTTSHRKLSVKCVNTGSHYTKIKTSSTILCCSQCK